MSKRNEVDPSTGAGSPSHKVPKHQEDGSPAAAAAREDEDVPFALPPEQHFPRECWEPIAAFASANSLCALDATAKMFNNGITESAWASRAMECFGLSCDKKKAGERSKLVWRLGMSLIRGQDKRRFFKLKSHPTIRFSGAPTMCACSTFIAVASIGIDDGPDGDGNHSFGYIFLRDSRTLEIVRTLRAPIPVFDITICGPENGETIVVSSFRQVTAIYPGFTSVRTANLDFRSKDDDDEETSRLLCIFPDAIPMIGSEKHLLVYRGGRLFVFQVTINGISLHSKRDFLTAEQLQECGDITRDSLAWGTKSGEFALLPGDGRICVCKLDPNTSKIEEIQSVTGAFYEKEEEPLDEPLVYKNVALSDNFIAVCPESSKRILIFERASGKQIHSLFDGSGEEPEDVIWSVRLHVLGDLLFSTSSSGNALVVWNMKTGKLLQRCEEAFDAGMSNSREENDCFIDATSMVCIHGDGYIAFSTNTCSETAWVFYESRDGQSEANRLFMCHSHREEDSDYDGDY